MLGVVFLPYFTRTVFIFHEFVHHVTKTLKFHYAKCVSSLSQLISSSRITDACFVIQTPAQTRKL